MSVTLTEPWLDKRKLAEHLSCSVQSVELAMARGMPYRVFRFSIEDRVERFRASEAEAWMRRNRRRNWGSKRIPRRRFGDYGQILLADPCTYCGVEAEHVDHIVALVRGGEDGWTNYTAACRPCNQSKGAKAALVWMAMR